MKDEEVQEMLQKTEPKVSGKDPEVYFENLFQNRAEAEETVVWEEAPKPPEKPKKQKKKVTFEQGVKEHHREEEKPQKVSLFK